MSLSFFATFFDVLRAGFVWMVRFAGLLIVVWMVKCAVKTFIERWRASLLRKCAWDMEMVNGTEMVVITKSGSVEVSTFRIGVCWFPWPHAVPSRLVLAKHDFAAFRNIVQRVADGTALATFEGAVAATLHTTLLSPQGPAARLRDREANNVSKRLGEMLSDKGNIQRVAEQALLIHAKSAADTVHLQHVLRAQCVVEDVISDSGLVIVERGVSCFAGSTHAIKEGNATLPFPPGTRFCYTRGARTLFVVEEPPTVRTLFFSAEFFSEWKMEIPPDNGVRLALPFVVFFISFDGEKLRDVGTCFANESLWSADSIVSHCSLPQVPSPVPGHRRCLGAFGPAGTLCEQVQQVITRFWHTTFASAGEHATVFRKKAAEDPRLGLKEWARRTAAGDIGFVTEVSWSGKFTLGGVAETFLLKDNPATPDVARLAFQKVVEEQVSLSKAALAQKLAGCVADIPSVAGVHTGLMQAFSSLGTALANHLKATPSGKRGPQRVKLSEQFEEQFAKEVVDAVVASVTKGASCLQDPTLTVDKLFKQLNGRQPSS